MTGDTPIALNALETARFGIVAARTTDAGATPQALDVAAKAKGVQLLTTRVDSAAIATVNGLEAAGHRLMDTLVHYTRALDTPPPAPAPPDGLILRQASPADAEAVTGIAETAFSGYFGHYHSDPRLDRAAADAAYVDWARRSTAELDADTPVLLATDSETVIAFLTLRRNAPDTVDLVLSGVALEGQGKGLYTLLIAYGIATAHAMGATQVDTSTQLPNIPVQRSWARLGFRLARAEHTFHKWYDDAGG